MVGIGRKLLPASGILLAILSGQLIAGEGHLPQSLPLSDTPYRLLAALESNQLNESRSVVLANRETGVLQISALVRRTNFEEQWAYIPSAHIWIEIGRNEKTSQKDSEVELDFGYLQQIASVYDAVHIVHFHPSSFYTGGRWADRMFGVDHEASDLSGDEVAMIGLALPSPSDVVASIQLVELFGSQNSGLELQFSVISPHGQVDYGATRSGVEKIIYNIGNPRMNYARELATISAMRRSPMNIARTIASSSTPTIGEVISALCAQITNEDYSISHEPLSDEFFAQRE